MSDLTIEQYFENFPLVKPRKLTLEDCRKVLSICIKTTELYSNRNDMAYSKKVDDYMSYCRKIVNEEFSDLTYESQVELNKFLNFYAHFTIFDYLSKQ